MEAALATERAALKETGGITDGAVAVGVKPSTPRSPADVRPERMRSADPDVFGPPTGREEEWRFTPLARLRVLLDGAGAALQLVQVQDWADDSVHGAHVASRLGRDAKLVSTQVTLGGDLVRVNETVDFTGTGADVALRGVSFADRGQHLEHRLLVEHSVPHCRSDVLYKSALHGDAAHTV